MQITRNVMGWDRGQIVLMVGAAVVGNIAFFAVVIAMLAVAAKWVMQG